MKNLRSGTIVELFDPSSSPSEAALGEVCLFVNECGYGVTEVEDKSNSTIIMFENSEMNVNGSIIIDRSTGLFNVSVIDSLGKSHNITTNKDVTAFKHMKRYLNEEVELRDKYNSLEQSSKYILSWILRQYMASGVYVFSFNDLGIDIDESTKEEAINDLVDQGFLRMSKKNVLVLDRTLADDLRELIK